MAVVQLSPVYSLKILVEYAWLSSAIFQNNPLD